MNASARTSPLFNFEKRKSVGGWKDLTFILIFALALAPLNFATIAASKGFTVSD